MTDLFLTLGVVLAGVALYALWQFVVWPHIQACMGHTVAEHDVDLPSTDQRDDDWPDRGMW